MIHFFEPCLHVCDVLWWIQFIDFIRLSNVHLTNNGRRLFFLCKLQRQVINILKSLRSTFQDLQTPWCNVNINCNDKTYEFENKFSIYNTHKMVLFLFQIITFLSIHLSEGQNRKCPFLYHQQWEYKCCCCCFDSFYSVPGKNLVNLLTPTSCLVGRL